MFAAPDIVLTMNPLAKQFLNASSNQKRTIHFKLCKHALDKWRNYAKAQGQIHYRESVCGTKQFVDTVLPEDAFMAARQGRDTGFVAKRYLEPIAAMQDDDLISPEAITYAYYAVYNLFRKYAGVSEVDDWLIINQALSSESNELMWQKMLQEAIDDAL